MRMTKRLWWIPALVALCLLSPQPGDSQQSSWSYRTTSGGWIGVTVEYQMQTIGNQTETLVLIKEVQEGSPAAAAGLMVGDVITHMDGRPVSQKYFSSLPQNLEAGDLVEMVIRRGDGPVEVTVEAVERPSTLVVYQPDIARMVVTLDTLRGAIYRDLEALTVTMNELHLQGNEGHVTIEVLTNPSDELTTSSKGTIFRFPEAAFDTLSMGRNAFVVTPEYTMAFQDFFVGSEEREASLRQALVLLGRELTEVRRQEFSRQRQIAATVQGPTEEFMRKDELILKLGAQEKELVLQQERMANQLSRVREEAMEQGWVEAESQEEIGYREAIRVREEEAARALDQVYNLRFRGFRSPLLIGQDFILGADMKPLIPAMAEMLSLDRGVLVYQVPDGTPASEAGLRDLDVIVQIAGEEINTIGDLRLSLEVFPRPIRIQVIRKGEPVEIIIRK